MIKKLLILCAIGLSAQLNGVNFSINFKQQAGIEDKTILELPEAQLVLDKNPHIVLSSDGFTTDSSGQRVQTIAIKRKNEVLNLILELPKENGAVIVLDNMRSNESVDTGIYRGPLREDDAIAFDVELAEAFTEKSKLTQPTLLIPAQTKQVDELEKSQVSEHKEYSLLSVSPLALSIEEDKGMKRKPILRIVESDEDEDISLPLRVDTPTERPDIREPLPISPFALSDDETDSEGPKPVLRVLGDSSED